VSLEKPGGFVASRPVGSRIRLGGGLQPISPPPLARSAGEGPGVRVARIAAGFLDRLRRSLAVPPMLSQREREPWDRLLVKPVIPQLPSRRRHRCWSDVHSVHDQRANYWALLEFLRPISPD